MVSHTDTTPLGADIRSLLTRLRRRIRLYVWMEGFALALVWLGTTFWIGLAIDYLPVLVGASEMPRGARLILLIVIAVVLAYVMYRWIFMRAFARMPDHSMAVLLERRFRGFSDGLVTAVEMSERPDHARQFSQEMLARTSSQALAQTDSVTVGEVFRLSPLVSKILLALTVIAPIGLLYAVNAQAVETWMSRLYLLQDKPWPRNTEVEVVGIQIERAPTKDGVTSLTESIPFDGNREVKVAKGTSIILKVRANAAKVIPEYCTVYYDTDESDRGSVNMQKFGRIQDDSQMFVFDGKPFRGILSTITFDVRGNDHRVRDYRLTVVPSPAIVEAKLECVFPSYMVNERLSLWLPRTIELASGTQLPNGTRVKLHARSNKDLEKVEIHNLQAETTTTLDLTNLSDDRRQIDYLIEQLSGNVTLEITLYDTDGVVSDPPIAVSVGGIEDQPPIVEAGLRGIGTAVTPDVVIPARGRVHDDYDVDASWFDVVVNEGEPRKYSFKLGEAGRVDAKLDFRTERASEDAVELKPKDKLTVTVMASDKCDLGEASNDGSGDRYQLDVVTPDELLAMLERRELGLRRRLEQIIDEMNQLRDSVSRVKRSGEQSPGTAPEDALKKENASEAGDAPKTGPTIDSEQRDRSLRLLRTQRAVVQSEKSSQEVLGVAASFDDICEELINNRVDSEDRKARLKDQVADPLRLVGEIMFPNLDLQLKELEKQLDDPVAGDEAVGAAVQQADDILLELDKVLQKILELETFNELMNIVRSLIEDQDQLIDKTKKERVDQARDLLK